MTLGEAKVIIRALSGRGDITPVLLDYFIAKGRREIETREGFYWMRNLKSFNLTLSQGDYGISTSASNGLSLPAFKDVRILLFKDPNEVRYRELQDYEIDRLATNYDTDSDGPPETYTIDNDTLMIFPRVPDKAYNMRLYYYGWTSNPDGDTDTDELLTHWPDALIYASIAHAVLALTREADQAKPWFDLLGTEMKKLTAYNHQRGVATHVDLIPRTGPDIRRVMDSWRFW